MEDALTQAGTALSDPVIIRLLQSDPSHGIAALYDRYGRLVFSVAFRVVEDHGVAEEIVQDVFLRCWRTIDQYHEEQGALITWILTITRNRSIDELRSRRGRQARREVSDELLAPMAVESEIDEAILRDEIRNALVDLPEAQREVISLVFWGGLSRREVAEQLGLPLGTVHTRLRLAMDKLRVTLGRWLHEP